MSIEIRLLREGDDAVLGQVAPINEVAVAPGWRRRGLAKAMLKGCCRLAAPPREPER